LERFYFSADCEHFVVPCCTHCCAEPQGCLANSKSNFFGCLLAWLALASDCTMYKHSIFSSETRPAAEAFLSSPLSILSQKALKICSSVFCMMSGWCNWLGEHFYYILLINTWIQKLICLITLFRSFVW
jgi:hypothetical protein